MTKAMEPDWFYDLVHRRGAAEGLDADLRDLLVSATRGVATESVVRERAAEEQRRLEAEERARQERERSELARVTKARTERQAVLDLSRHNASVGFVVALASLVVNPFAITSIVAIVKCANALGVFTPEEDVDGVRRTAVVGIVVALIGIVLGVFLAGYVFAGWGR